MTEAACSMKNPRGLAWLVGELDDFKGVLDGPTVRRFLTQAKLDREEVASYIEQRADTYARRCVVRRENYEVLVLTWCPSQGSVAHDHSGSLCGLKVVQGSLTEQLFEEAPDGRVRKTSSNRLGPGDITIDPGAVVHSLANSLPGEVLVTVHVYSPPLPEVRRYAVAEGLPPALFLRPARPDAKVIAIIGGGFTGLMAMANLIRFGNETDLPLHIVLMDRQPAVGEGIAYRTTDGRHLLNVPAGRMSAWPDLREDFLAFARLKDSSVGPHDFLPRRIYGQYVRETMLDLAEAAGEHLSAEVMHDEVALLEPSVSSGWKIETAGHRSVQADLAVLAVGHRPPNDPLSKGWIGPRTRFVTDPWAALVLSQIGPDEPVLLIGSGLTAVDVILTLNRPDRVAPLIAVSRRGLTPLAHLRQQNQVADVSALVSEWLDPAAMLKIGDLVSGLRRRIAAARDSGIEWQYVIDALRPVIQRLWNRLGVKERARFLRHVRPFWEIHRHRMAPSITDIIDRLRREKKLEVVAGALVAASADEDGVDVTFSLRGASAARSVRVSWVVNCTGPGAHNRHETHPFLRPLLGAGILCSDELSLGLLTDDCGRAIAADGGTHPDLLIAGTLRKSTLWESTAVPELRQQAQTVARTALAVLSSREALPILSRLRPSVAELAPILDCGSSM
ncbi:MAG: FAD/NAD(P)-binding protein [Terracidiphilus sp.]